MSIEILFISGLTTGVLIWSRNILKKIFFAIKFSRIHLGRCVTVMNVVNRAICVYECKYTYNLMKSIKLHHPQNGG